jgi:chemotaxis protein MotB
MIPRIESPRLNRKTEHEIEQSSYAWMLTFSDLLLLLLTLFVLRLSMSSLDGNTLHRALSAFMYNTTSKARPSASRATNELSIAAPERSLEIQQLITALSKALNHDQGEAQGQRESGGLRVLGNSVSITPEQESVLLRLDSSSFPQGGVELSFGAQRTLSALGSSLQKENVRIEISAHSDKEAPSEPRFPTNWELSAAQASVAARQIIDAGVDPQSISLMGYGSALPIAEGNTVGSRHQNRRLEIRVTPLRK